MFSLAFHNTSIYVIYITHVSIYIFISYLYILCLCFISRHDTILDQRQQSGFKKPEGERYVDDDGGGGEDDKSNEFDLFVKCQAIRNHE